MKSILVNTARQVNTAHSKTTVNAARSMSYLSKTAHSTVKNPIHKNTKFKNSNVNQRVNTFRGKNVNTARPKAVVNAVNGNNLNAVWASACRGNPQMDLQDKGVIDSGCSRIENLVDHKVKVIRRDNETKFKNREMNQFCEMKGVLRQFSVARTLQQNRVAKRRNRTLIEAAKTMLADSNKAFSVFNSKTRIVEENLHIRFSESTTYVVSSGPDWLFDTDALTRTINYKPIVTGTQSNGFAGTKANDNASQARKET
nr:putative ribonuclease H-like domain-containing protein [Tanacetum cinerariifolium]